MTKENYSAWNINPGDFPSDSKDIDKLLYFARYAILAPSGHNSQPWMFAAKGNELFLKLHPSRHLKNTEEGLLEVEPYISLGCCVEVFRLAAMGFGYKLNIKLILENDKIAQFSLNTRVEPDPSLLKAIVNRVSNRNLFVPNPLDHKLFNNILGNNFENASLYPITDKAEIEYMTKQTFSAAQKIIANPVYRGELSRWVRNNYTNRYDGMPGFTHGIPSIPSFLAKPMVKNMKKSEKQATKIADLVTNSSSLALIVVHEKTKEAFIYSGRLYARSCILAQKFNIASSGVGASLVDPTSREQVKNHFKLTHEPIALLRFGKATIKSHHSPRWPIRKLIG